MKKIVNSLMPGVLMLVVAFSAASCNKTQAAPAAATSAAPGQPVDLTYAAEKSLPSVVYIKSVINSKTQTVEYSDPFEDFFSDPFGGFFGRGQGNNNGKRQRQVQTPKRVAAGSGVIISADGYIVTNNHVASEAKTINIKGIKGDMNTGYVAEVVATDKVNDIAILKITDSQFKGFGTIPYAVQQRMSDVGEDVFVLGYPLTQALGNEIKLTNGIISSRTGYQGNISTYQMSAPVQPGNSGGPMFDNKGNVIGIVVAGVPGAENVGYAIKTSYLKILIESAGLDIRLPANNTISTLSLAEKVMRVKEFVFYIECSK